VLEVAEAVRRHAKPGAWIVDFTNPVGIVTRALLEEGHRAIGLCNVAIGFQRRFARMLDADPAFVRLEHVGLNHLTWERGAARRRPMCCRSCCGSASPELADEVELPAPLLQNLAMVPSYYLRYFYAHDRVLEEQRHEPPRAEKVMEVERELLRLYADPSVDAKPAVLAARGGAFYSEAAVDLIASLLSDRGDVQVANLRNGGTLPFLPDDHVVEVSATIGAAGPVAVPASAGTTQGPDRPCRGLRAARPRRRTAHRIRRARAAARRTRCSPTRSSASGTARRSSPICSSTTTGITSRGRGERHGGADRAGLPATHPEGIVVAIDGGGTKTDAVALMRPVRSSPMCVWARPMCTPDGRGNRPPSSTRPSGGAREAGGGRC
jgi:hypothetical protein